MCTDEILPPCHDMTRPHWYSLANSIWNGRISHSCNDTFDKVEGTTSVSECTCFVASDTKKSIETYHSYLAKVESSASAADAQEAPCPRQSRMPIGCA